MHSCPRSDFDWCTTDKAPVGTKRSSVADRLTRDTPPHYLGAVLARSPQTARNIAHLIFFDDFYLLGLVAHLESRVPRTAITVCHECARPGASSSRNRLIKRGKLLRIDLMSSQRQIWRPRRMMKSTMKSSDCRLCIWRTDNCVRTRRN